MRTVLTMDDVDHRLQRARDGKLSNEELQQVVSEIESGESSTDTYMLLHIIGHAPGGETYQSLVERFLNHDDAMVMRIALQILCQWWGKSAQYEEEILRFMSGDERDIEGHARLMAISCAGKLLTTQRDARMLEAIVTIALNLAEEDPFRGAAEDAIVEAAGMSLIDWIRPETRAHMRLDEIIATAKERHSSPHV
jgi:hypothetical protein